MIRGIHFEVLLALAYSLFLGGVAFVLELLARRTQKRAEGYRNSGFIYFRELNYWECPAGHQLVQLQTDHVRRITSYRAPADACNSCSLKLNCTDSNEGRILEQRMDNWLESGLHRFHRGMSLSVLLLATVFLAAEFVRYPHVKDREVLLALLFPMLMVQWKLLASLRLLHEENSMQ